MVANESEPQAELPSFSSDAVVQPAPSAINLQKTAKSSITPSRRRPSRRLLRYFLIQLLPVTAGILIALLIDGLIELRRQALLVDEAHAALAVEIASNNADLLETMPSLEQMQQVLVQAVTYIDDLLTTGTTDITSIKFQLNTPSLNQASWETAQRTGALGYMDYAAVKEYAELYSLQDLVVASQNRMIEHFADMGVLIHAMESGKPTARPQDLESSRTIVLQWIMTIGVHRGLASQLATAYEQIPTELAEADYSNQ